MSPLHRLIILRHAKSSWSTPLPDHERPLNKRGNRDALAAGEWLAAHTGTVDQVLCSTATRTRLTWERAQAGGASANSVSFHDDIYGNAVPEFEHLILGLPESVGTALLIGHWPGVLELAHHFGMPDAHPGWAQMDEKFPTSGIAVLGSEMRWKQLRERSAKLRDFVVPRG